MEKINKKIEIDMYVASDGTEFDDEWDCLVYEERQLCKQIHAIGAYAYQASSLDSTIVFCIDDEETLEFYKEILKNNYCNDTSRGKPDAEIGKIYVYNDTKKEFVEYPSQF